MGAIGFLEPAHARPAAPGRVVREFIGGPGYFCWGYGRLFPQRPWIAAAGGLTALASGLALWALALVRFLAAFRQ